MADYIYMMENRLTLEQQRGVTLVRDVARAHGMNVYLVGGVVRDIISGANIRDLDFAVQGNALKLQKDLEKAGAVIEGVDEHFHSLYVLLPGNLRGEVSSARAETYEKPGKPPTITFAPINEDLRRRDFTINAMALSLNPGSRGLLLDPFNGVADIESKLIRILHNYAFLDDPSRLIRATRLAARLDWTLEERTQARYNAAKENDYIEFIQRRAIGHEIEQLAFENDPLKVLKALEKENWLRVLHSHWSVARVDVPGLNHLLKIRQQMRDLGYMLDSGPAVMYFLTSKLNSSDVHTIETLIPRKAFVVHWKHLEDDVKDLVKKLTGKDAALPSQAWKLLSDAKPEAILFAAATAKNSAAVKKIADFLGKWRQVRTKLPLPEMAEMRITPDLPTYPKLTGEMFLMLLDGKLRSQTEIRKFLQPYSPPEPVAPPVAVRRGRGAKKAEAAAATKKEKENEVEIAKGEKPKSRRGRKAITESAQTTVPTNPENLTGKMAQAKAEVAPGAVHHAVSKAVGTELSAQPKSKPALKAQPKAIIKSKPKPKAATKPKKAVKPNAKSNAKSNPKQKLKAAAKTKAKSHPKSRSKLKPKPRPVAKKKRR